MTDTTVVPPEPPPVPPADDLPPPPDAGRAVANLWERLGGFGLELVLVPCTFVFGWVGWWIIAWADGQTPSKVLLHLHVANVKDGELASFGRMALREALGKGIGAVLVLAGGYYRVIPIAAAGVLYTIAGSVFALADPRRRTAWDRLAGTVVVEGDPPPFVPPAPDSDDPSSTEASHDEPPYGPIIAPEERGTEPS